MNNQQLAVRGAGYGGALYAGGNLVARALRGEFDAEANRARHLGRRAREVVEEIRTRRGRRTANDQPLEMPNSVGGRRYAGFRSGRSNRVVSRKRIRSRGRRRRLRFGTRVRKQALGLFEGKRHGRVSSVTSLTALSVKRMTPMEGMVTAESFPASQGSLTIQQAERHGLKIFVRGIRFNAHFSNKNTTQPVDLRLILGWRKKPRDGGAVGTAGEEMAIFKNRDTTKEPVLLDATDEALNLKCSAGTAPLCASKYFYCAKDMMVRLGPKAADSSEGSSFRFIKMWWELNNKVNQLEKDELSAAANNTEKIMDWYPCLYYYGVDPSNSGVSPVVNVTVKIVSTCYWKDPHG